MKYRYELYKGRPPGSPYIDDRLDVFIRFDTVKPLNEGEYILVFDQTNKDKVKTRLINNSDVAMWRDQLDREFYWIDNDHKKQAEFLREKDKAKLTNDAINPAHYKEIIPGYQYMEMMQYMLKDKSGVDAHLYGQIYKYLMRTGKKDDEIKELQKAKWYLNFLIAHKVSGKPITVEEIQKLLVIGGSIL